MQFLNLSDDFIELEHYSASHSSANYDCLSLNKSIFSSGIWHGPLIFFPVATGSMPNHEILSQELEASYLLNIVHILIFFSFNSSFFNDNSQKVCKPPYLSKLKMLFLIKAVWDPNMQRKFHELLLLFVFYYYYWLDRKLPLKEAENPKCTDVYVVGHYWFLHLGWHNNAWTKIQPSIYIQVMSSRTENMLYEIHFRRQWELIV